MTVLPADIKIEYPEFSTLLDVQIQPILNQAGRQIQDPPWGTYLDDGIKAFTAHALLIKYQIQLELVDRLKSIESDKSIRPQNFTSDDYFKTTVYGLQYLQLRDLINSSVGFVV